jgi:hypothetical protein
MTLTFPGVAALKYRPIVRRQLLVLPDVEPTGIATRIPCYGDSVRRLP